MYIVAVGNVIYTPKPALTENDVVDNLLGISGRLPLSDRQGKILNEYIQRVERFSKKQTEIVINGSVDMFYPVTINPIEAYRMTTVEITKSYVSGEGRSSKAMWICSSNGWGATHGVLVLKYYNARKYGEPSDIDKRRKMIAKAMLPSYFGNNNFIVWLRGDARYIITADVANHEIKTNIFYERADIGIEGYPLVIEPINKIDPEYDVDTEINNL